MQKQIKLATLLKWIEQGKIECVTDIKIGYVEILNLKTYKYQYVQVIN